jgi:hypothetical protein
MKLIIREFLSQLKESGELDRLLPDLLSRMKLIPISRPQIGVRQNGVDIAAVGKDDFGVKTLFLFVLKVGDLGRRDWDDGVNAIRPTLNQIKDSYLRSFVQPEHKSLPVKIVVCTTGNLKQEVTPDFNGYVEGSAREGLAIEFWSGDKVASLIDTHLLDEYAMNPRERTDMRKAIALIGTKDYDLRHAYKLFEDLLLKSHQSGSGAGSRERKIFIRQAKTAALALEVIFRWAAEEGNLLNAMKCAERCCLWTWEAIRMRGLLDYRPALSVYADIFNIYERVCYAYFEKIQRHCFVRDAMSTYAGEGSLVALKVYEQIGVISLIGVTQVQRSILNPSDGRSVENAQVVVEGLVALIRNNPASGSPRFDENAIELSLALFVLLATGKHDAAKEWIESISSRLAWSLRRGKGFPIASDSLDDLIALDLGELEDDEVKKLHDLSTLIPTLIHWCVIFGLDELYRQWQSVQSTLLDGMCLQLWYADEDTEAGIYKGPAQFDSGSTEAPIVFPDDPKKLISACQQLLDSKTIPDLTFASCIQKDHFGLILIACRHFRTPFPPQLWMPFLQNLSIPQRDTAPGLG